MQSHCTPVLDQVNWLRGATHPEGLFFSCEGLELLALTGKKYVRLVGSQKASLIFVKSRLHFVLLLALKKLICALLHCELKEKQRERLLTAFSSCLAQFKRKICNIPTHVTYPGSETRGKFGKIIYMALSNLSMK